MSRVSQRDHSVPLFTREHYEYLLRVFPKDTINPSKSDREIMYNSGQQSVLEHVLSKVGQPTRVQLSNREEAR